jgi:transcriptional regulator of NAD metabolism
MFRRILCFYQKTHTIRSTPLSSSSSSKDINSIMKKLMDDKQYKQVLDLFDKQTKPCNDVITHMVIKACIHLNKHQRITDIQEKLSPQLLNNPYIQTTLIQFYSELFIFFLMKFLLNKI